MNVIHRCKIAIALIEVNECKRLLTTVSRQGVKS
jgi:hypothetical protein